MHAGRALRLAVLGAIMGCGFEPAGPIPPDEETIAKLTITAQPGEPTLAHTVGYSQLGLATPRDGFMYVPASYQPDVAAPLLVLLHGPGADRTQWSTAQIEAAANERGMVILAIDSRFQTWDVAAIGRYDHDVAFLNSALAHVFQRVRVDSLRIAIGGFSDGAAEALGIGVANAKLFRKIIAFSPSRLYLPFARGFPKIFVSHGTQDTVIPYSNTENVIVPTLRANGMEVSFFPFTGDHELTQDILSTALSWLFL